MRLSKKVLILSCLSLAFVSNANNETLTKKMPTFEVSTTIKPGERQEVSNPMWFDITANCRVDTKGQNVNFAIEIIDGDGTVNGKHYFAPNRLDPYPVSNGQNFNFIVGGSAKVALTLKQEGSTQAVDAHCNIAF